MRKKEQKLPKAQFRKVSTLLALTHSFHASSSLIFHSLSPKNVVNGMGADKEREGRKHKIIVKNTSPCLFPALLTHHFPILQRTEFKEETQKTKKKQF